MAVTLGPTRQAEGIQVLIIHNPRIIHQDQCAVPEGYFATRMTGSSQHLRENDPLSAVPSHSTECMTPMKSTTSTPPQFELRCGGLHLLI